MRKLVNQMEKLEIIEGYELYEDELQRIRAYTYVDDDCSPLIERDHEPDPIPEYVDEEWLVNALKVVRKLKKKQELLQNDN